MLTQEKLKELVDYCPVTGHFTWKERSIDKFKSARDMKIWNAKNSGRKAGSTTDQGYTTIRHKGKHVRAHRLAWLYVYGELPSNQIDHINGIRTDNKIANLREVTNSENQQNRKYARSDNVSTGLIGVRKMRSGRFASQISVNCKYKYIGSYDTPDQAHNAYLIAKRELHPFGTL